MPLASTETAIASTVKLGAAPSIPKEIGPKPAPTPTPSDADLCAKAVREVEGSRQLIDTQAKYIDSLEKQAGGFQDKLRAQSELLDEYRKVNEEAKGITAQYAKLIENKDAVIANKDKEIAELKKRKSSPLTRIGDILIGIAAGIVLTR